MEMTVTTPVYKVNATFSRRFFKILIFKILKLINKAVFNCIKFVVIMRSPSSFLLIHLFPPLLLSPSSCELSAIG